MSAWRHRIVNRSASLLMVGMLAVASASAGQAPGVAPATGGRQLTVAIFPFADATASGNRTAGLDIARTCRPRWCTPRA